MDNKINGFLCLINEEGKIKKVILKENNLKGKIRENKLFPGLVAESYFEKVLKFLSEVKRKKTKYNCKIRFNFKNNNSSYILNAILIKNNEILLSGINKPEKLLKQYAYLIQNQEKQELFHKFHQLIISFCNFKSNDNNNEMYNELSRINNQLTNMQRELTKKNKQLQKQKNKYHITLSSIEDGVLTTDSNGKINYINPVGEEIMERKKDEVNDKYYNNIWNIKDKKTKEKINIDKNKILKNGESIASQKAVLLEKPNNNMVPIEYNISPSVSKNQILGMVIVFRDVTQKIEWKEKIEYLSIHDKMTDLYNRAYLEDKIKNLDSAKYIPLTLIIGDVNGLKMVNDAFGHKEGDKIIKNAARLLQESCRQEDICGRWGGDEFLLILPQTQKKAASKIIKRIKDNADKYESNLPVSIAFGFSTKNENGQDINEILQQADENMYENKLKESQKNKNRLMEMLFDKLEKNKFVTKKHCQRVSLLAESLGKEIDLTQTQLDKLKLTAKFHDIGYLTLSDKVNSKKEMLKKHVKIGYRIARASKEYAHIGMGILHHHENWDGTGYPDQQKEKEIPLDSRIIALVDFYDRLTETQTQSNSKENIIKVIKSESGKKFDPELVSVFIKCCIMKMRNR